MARKNIVREVVIGGIAGHLVSAVYRHLVDGIRKGAIEHALTYSHAATDIREIPFMGVYSDRDLISKVGLDSAYPERSLPFWSVERVVIVTDDNPTEVPNHSRSIVGLVVMRHPDMGPSRPQRDVVRRFKVILNAHYADNGNTFVWEAEVSIFNPMPQEDLQLAQVAG